MCIRINEDETWVCEETDTRKRSAKVKTAKSMLDMLDESDVEWTNASSVCIKNVPNNVAARSSEEATDTGALSTASHSNGSTGATSDKLCLKNISVLQVR